MWTVDVMRILGLNVIITILCTIVTKLTTVTRQYPIQRIYNLVITNHFVGWTGINNAIVKLIYIFVKITGIFRSD